MGPSQLSYLKTIMDQPIHRGGKLGLMPNFIPKKSIFFRESLKKAFNKLDTEKWFP